MNNEYFLSDGIRRNRRRGGIRQNWRMDWPCGVGCRQDWRMEPKGGEGRMLSGKMDESFLIHRGDVCHFKDLGFEGGVDAKRAVEKGRDHFALGHQVIELSTAVPVDGVRM